MKVWFFPCAQECAQYYRQQLEGLGENPSDIPFEEEVSPFDSRKAYVLSLSD